MCNEPSIGISRALGIARAFWELANEGVNEGILPGQQAATMAKAAIEGSATMRSVIADLCHRLSPEMTKAAEDSIIDLETLSALAELAATPQLTPKNSEHLARAMRHTAAQAIRSLSRAESALNNASSFIPD